MDLVFPQASRTNAAIVGLFKYLRGEPEDHPQRTKSSETTGATLDILPTTPIEPRQLPAHVSKNQTRTVRAKAPPQTHSVRVVRHQRYQTMGEKAALEEMALEEVALEEMTLDEADLEEMTLDETGMEMTTMSCLLICLILFLGLVIITVIHLNGVGIV